MSISTPKNRSATRQDRSSRVQSPTRSRTWARSTIYVACLGIRSVARTISAPTSRPAAWVPTSPRPAGSSTSWARTSRTAHDAGQGAWFWISSIGTMDDLQALRAELTGRYEIEHELGRGGMATVFLARDVRHDRRVAIKVLR